MNPKQLIDNAFRLLAGKFYLRNCSRVGIRPRVYGHPRITNLGRIDIGDRFIMFNQTVRSEMVAHPEGWIDIGDRVFLNYGASLSAHRLVRIGAGCQIGSYVCMMDNDYHQVEDRSRPGESSPIVLEKNVWLGVRVIVLKGVRIGENAVVGAGSVVTGDIPPDVFAAGVPARVIRRFGKEGR